MRQSKFAGLRSHLEKEEQKQLTMNFTQIEKLIGEELCPSARKYKVYWNPSRTHTCALVIEEAGYQVKNVDLETETVWLEKKEN